MASLLSSVSPLFAPPPCSSGYPLPPPCFAMATELERAKVLLGGMAVLSMCCTCAEHVMHVCRDGSTRRGLLYRGPKRFVMPCKSTVGKRCAAPFPFVLKSFCVRVGRGHNVHSFFAYEWDSGILYILFCRLLGEWHFAHPFSCEYELEGGIWEIVFVGAVLTMGCL